MGLIEKKEAEAISGSDNPSLTIAKNAWLLLIHILWGCLRKAKAGQVVAQLS
jgi:hypothetical protein